MATLEVVARPVAIQTPYTLRSTLARPCRAKQQHLRSPASDMQGSPTKRRMRISLLLPTCRCNAQHEAQQCYHAAVLHRIVLHSTTYQRSRMLARSTQSQCGRARRFHPLGSAPRGFGLHRRARERTSARGHRAAVRSGIGSMRVNFSQKCGSKQSAQPGLPSSSTTSRAERRAMWSRIAARLLLDRL